MFDMKGGRVKVIANSVKAAGVHRERVAASGLAAGVYVVKLRARNAVLNEKILISRR